MCINAQIHNHNRKNKHNYSAYCPDLPGCVATERTEEEVIRNMKEAIEFHLEGLRQEKLPILEAKTIAYQLEVV